ncbi:MAG: DUF4012 domain-containing protein [Methanobrevibacter sp.]|jgi:hypothetical protein|nr:DUF4012 domain-containing protein [Candidatus Methanoflexus mossambicus]
MNTNKKIALIVMIVSIIGIIAIGYGLITGDSIIGDSDLIHGSKKILVLCVDESESRQGLGAVDMAFVVSLEDGSIVKYTPFYPGGMTHPTASEPAEAQAQGAGSRLLLHDSLWNADNEKGLELAKEIVEYQYKVQIDAVVAVNTQAMDAIIDASGIEDGQTNISAADLVRENDQLHGGTMNRADAVKTLAKKISQAATNDNTKTAMIQTALDQYNAGNIIALPMNAFVQLVSSKGFGSMVSQI